jgi:NAD(P)H dehydrogenase (quinone)
MKITVLYVSCSGNTEKTAGFVREGILQAGDIDVKLMNIISEESLDADFIKESAAVIIGTPTYAAAMSWQLKKWFDTSKIKLAGKLGAAFATANYVYGGADIALADILQHMLVKGMVAYSSGTGCGNPIIHLGPVAITSDFDASKDLFVIFGKRVADKTLELFGQK